MVGINSPAPPANGARLDGPRREGVVLAQAQTAPSATAGLPRLPPPPPTAVPSSHPAAGPVAVFNAPNTDAKVIRTNPRSAQIGDTKVDVLSHTAPGSSSVFINVHDDENTAVVAGLKHIGKHGGLLVELKHKGTRNIDFLLEGKKYTFDPNRIFTEAGRKATLRGASPPSSDARRAVENFSKYLVDSLGEKTGTIVALHNSRPGYSINSYFGQFKRDAAEVFVNPKRDPGDFFYVTTPDLFDAFKRKGFNVVLQSPHAADDGSLSVLCGMQKNDYINVETREGCELQQLEMLAAVQTVLAERQNAPQ